MPPMRRNDGAGSLFPALAILVIIVPLLYLLSFGPAIALVQWWDDGHQAVEVVYAPVVWLHDHTFLEKPLEAYAELWVGE